MPAGSTYTPIATTTLGSNVASYTFTSISGSYTDLILVITGTTTTNGINYWLQFNSDTGSNYSYTMILGTGSAASSGRSTSQTKWRVANNSSSTNTTPTIVQIQNYSNTTTYKTGLARFGDASYGTWANVGLWRSTSAITSITVSSDTNLASGSIYTLYGIASA